MFRHAHFGSLGRAEGEARSDSHLANCRSLPNSQLGEELVCRLLDVVQLVAQPLLRSPAKIHKMSGQKENYGGMRTKSE